jgi:hypothetical protein
VFTRPIECPVSAGKTCTFYLHLEAEAAVSVSDLGQFRFLVDGVAPVPGQTDPGGYVIYIYSNPDSSSVSARSYAVIAKVKNTTTNQLHPIEVDIGCVNVTSAHDGCNADINNRTLSTGVYTP